MPVLKLTEEDQALLVLLSSEQRDKVFLSLITGEAQDGMSEGTMAIYCGIRRRERERLLTNERGKRRDEKKRENKREINRENHREINRENHAPSPSSPCAPLSPPSLPPTPPITPPYNPPTTPSTTPITREAPAGAAPSVEAKKSFGEYGWVKLTESEYNRLLNDLGKAEVNRCIAYVDESAKMTGNKNKWRDWNLVVRKCHREQWGVSRQKTSNAPAPAHLSAGGTKQDDMEAMRRIMREGRT